MARYLRVPCPVLTCRVWYWLALLVRVRYAMSGADVEYAATSQYSTPSLSATLVPIPISLCSFYTVSGTNVGCYGADQYWG
eukprot:1737858-Rhodomonas_salina.2